MPSSDARIAANRANAKKSTGPRTKAGKAAAAQNARTHGLSSATFAVLPHENESEYESLLAAYKEEFKPRNLHEEFLLEQMVDARWNIERCKRIRRCLQCMVSGGACKKTTPDFEAASDLRAHSNDPLGAIERYLAAGERSYHRAHRELTQQRIRETRLEIQQSRLPKTTEVVRYQPVAKPATPVQNEPNPPARPVAERPQDTALFPNAYRSLAMEALDQLKKGPREPDLSH